MKILITGGCGFIGSHAAVRFWQRGYDVVILDNLVRVGAQSNLSWLSALTEAIFVEGDVRQCSTVDHVVKKYRPDIVLHLAAQVAVTTSVIDPRVDFDTNALGTFNVLEAVRRFQPTAFFINASTNKVYGSLEQLSFDEGSTRYNPVGIFNGIDEQTPLNCHSPYGCSKGAADQYVTDYARIYDMQTVNFRQSCIYGPRQFGVEDQGWLAWFTIAHVLGLPITIFGTGKQVRDVLYIEDLIEAYVLAIEHRTAVSGRCFNIGGGLYNTLSIVESLTLLSDLSGKCVESDQRPWRPGDQPYYCSDIGSITAVLRWTPRTGVREGFTHLFDWVSRHLDLLSEMHILRVGANVL